MSRVMRLLVWTSLFVLAITPIPSSAQTGLATLTGLATDNSGAAVPGVRSHHAHEARPPGPPVLGVGPLRPVHQGDVTESPKPPEVRLELGLPLGVHVVPANRDDHLGLDPLRASQVLHRQPSGAGSQCTALSTTISRNRSGP